MLVSAVEQARLCRDVEYSRRAVELAETRGE